MVKVSGAKVDAFLRNPDPALRAVLFYGPDGGLVRERADGIASQIVDDLGDAFRVAELTAGMLKDDPARLADEAAALCFTGGRRVVRLRPATDAQATAIKEFLTNSPGEALVVVEAGELTPRSKLRKVFEAAGNAAALPCFADEGAALHRVIETTLAPHGLTLEPGVVEYLAAALGGDRLVTRSELEKLVTYMGAEKCVRLTDVEATVGDTALVTVDGVVLAAANGDMAGLERRLDQAYLEGIHPVGLLRAMSRHLQRLHRMAAAVQQGAALDGVLRGFRPPLHFRVADAMRKQHRQWPVGRVVKAMALVIDAERQCKTTGLPDRAICGRTFMALARAARR